MRFRSLAQLHRPDPREISLGALPGTIRMDRYASEKAFQINALARSLYEDSLEWYGFTLGRADAPDLIVDIGLPSNDVNLTVHTALSPEGIAAFRETLPEALLINGWIHSHGALTYQRFSPMDERNHQVVMDFVAAGLRMAIAKREVAIEDLVLLVKDRFMEADLAKGSVSLITDAPVREAIILETVYGSFCYAFVVGDGGWHEQEIHYREYGVLSGRTRSDRKETGITLVDTGRELSRFDVDILRVEVERKIRPNTNPPLETTERM